MVEDIKWVDYSGATPILLPVSIARYWKGFYLPANEDEEYPDLELPEGNYNIFDEFDFENPKTDYDRACALGGIPTIHSIPVGSGTGVVFATMLDPLTWWTQENMLVNGYPLPLEANLFRVDWSDGLIWQTIESDHILMNACEHGADPDITDYFEVKLEPGRYLIEYGEYGWKPNDDWLVLFRFLRHDAR